MAALQLQKAILILLVTRQLSNAFAPYQVRGKSKTFFDGGYHPLDVTKRPEVIGKQESTYIKPVVYDPPASPKAVKGAEVVSQASIQAERKFPVNMIVGHDDLKEAAVIAATNPNVSGILIGGKHGTGKSVMARAIHQLLPKSIERVKGSRYNIDPFGIGGIDSFLLEELKKNGANVSDMEKETVDTPFVQVPLNVMEDSLCGTVDIEKSMESGSPVFAPGLLAKAHRGVLYIDDIHLLDNDILSILFDVISDGSVKVCALPMVLCIVNPSTCNPYSN